ncbi:MAG: sensor histidine kinase [Promethearchaeota archaeon]
MRSYIKKILNYFFLIHKNDPEELRKKKILNIFLFITEFIDGWVILIYSIFLIAGSPIDGLERTIQILWLCVFAALGGIISFLINNYLSTPLATLNHLVLITLFIFISDSPYEVVLGRSLLLLVLPIIMAGYLVKPIASFIMSFIIIIVNLLICFINGFFPNFISLTIYILIAFMTWFSAINFEKSIKKHQEAYKRENFYKDLFAHDTNNILQNILMALELFEQDLKSSGDLYERKSLNLIKEQIDRGTHLIRNVRKFNTIFESERILKKIDFKKVLEETIENLKIRFERREVKIQIETSLQNFFVMANEFLLDVFENLLLNSVIHNENSIVDILIKISHIQEDGKQFLKAEFIDNGVGIPDSRKQNIFNRDSDMDKSLSGLGLGLSLVKNILDMYNAKILVESKIPENYTKGSNFILKFPEVQ